MNEEKLKKNKEQKKKKNCWIVKLIYQKNFAFEIFIDLYLNWKFSKYFLNI